MAPSVEKKIAELEMGLLHLQQNIDIPDISLPIHPTVAQVGMQTPVGIYVQIMIFCINYNFHDRCPTLINYNFHDDRCPTLIRF